MQVAEYHQFVPNTNSIPVLEKHFCEGLQFSNHHKCTYSEIVTPLLLLDLAEA